MWGFTVFFGAAKFYKLLLVSKMTNIAARPDLIHAVAAIPVTISGILMTL